VSQGEHRERVHQEEGGSVLGERELGGEHARRREQARERAGEGVSQGVSQEQASELGRE
jgi:hypothetical protein